MITLDTDISKSLSIKGSGKVIMKSFINIIGHNSTLEIHHISDFSNIPTEYHQIYFDAFKASVVDTTVYDNVGQPYPIKIEELQKKRWWNRIADIF